MRVGSIAIVDDDESFAEALVDRLLSVSIPAARFGGARQFLACADAREVDLAIVNLKVADSHGVHWAFAGVDAVRAIRRAGGERIRIWALSGLSRPHLLRACLANGANDFLSKEEGVAAIADKIAMLARMVASSTAGIRQRDHGFERRRVRMAR